MDPSYPTSNGNPGVLTRPNLLLVVFVHGFKGSGDAFGVFPDRLQEILRGSIADAVTECIVYPKYKTQGELSATVKDLRNWLKREVYIRVGRDTRKVKVVLCGHSMGGFITADTLIQLTEEPYAHAPPFPKIVACLSFDTPYLGLHAGALSSGVGRVIRIVKNAHGDGMLVLGGMAIIWVGTAVASGVAVIGAGGIIGAQFLGVAACSLFHWVEGHFDFIKHLWDEEELGLRLNTIVDYDRRRMVLFRTFFTSLPPYGECRAFINVPSRTGFAEYFLEASNHLAEDAIQAHIDMFKPGLNGGYHQLESETARLIKEAIML